MRFGHMEKIEGGAGSEPEILITQPAIAKLGMPIVEFESLHQYLTDYQGIPSDQQTQIVLVGSTDAAEEAKFLGYQLPFSRTIIANAVAAEARLPGSAGVMYVIGHEASHITDTRREMAERYLVPVLGFALVRSATRSWLPGSTVAGIAGAYGARAVHYVKFDTGEKRANVKALSDVTHAHETDILFPNSYRTLYLQAKGRLSARTIEQLQASSDRWNK